MGTYLLDVALGVEDVLPEILVIAVPIGLILVSIATIILLILKRRKQK